MPVPVEIPINIVIVTDHGRFDLGAAVRLKLRSHHLCVTVAKQLIRLSVM